MNKNKRHLDWHGEPNKIMYKQWAAFLGSAAIQMALVPLRLFAVGVIIS